MCYNILMVRAKKSKKTKNINAKKLHSRTNSLYPLPQSPAGKLILGVIIVAGIVVSFSLIFSFLFSPEHLAKSEFKALVSEYYEDYVYSKITDPTVLEKYQAVGLAPVSLRQLLLHDPALSPADHLSSLCDEDKTFAKIYPEPPYQKSNYRVEYTYACEF